MRYLKEIVKGLKNGKRIPGPVQLVRQYSQWTKHLRNRDALQNKIPWITFEAIEFLENFLRKDMRVFEFGGGGSTLFFASRVAELVTIEHDKEWFEGLRNEMRKYASLKWTGSFIEAEPVSSAANLDVSNPNDYYSSHDEFKNYIFKRYASSIDQYPDDYFDVVLIDGRVRPSCIQHSLAKVKIGGLLILDNSDREFYLERIEDKLDNYRLVINHTGPTPYVLFFSKTNIWKRTN